MVTLHEIFNETLPVRLPNTLLPVQLDHFIHVVVGKQITQALELRRKRGGFITQVDVNEAAPDFAGKARKLTAF